MPYREPLPDCCSPKNAEEIISKTICYRLVNNAPPIEDDFSSQRTLEPNRDFGVSECRARGLSVFMQAADAARTAQRSAAETFERQSWPSATGVK